MKLHQRRIVVLVVVLALMLTGCANLQKKSPQELAYKSLLSAQILYDRTMTALAEAHSKGMITDRQRDEAIRFGREFRRAYLNAVDLLIAGTQDDEAIALVQASLKVLMDYVTPLIVQGGTKK